MLIHLIDTSTNSEDQMVTITVFVSTGRVLIQQQQQQALFAWL